MERTYVMVKPDGVQRNLIGEVVTRFEKKGFKMVGLKMINISKEIAEEHYGEHKGKPFFEGLVSYITSGPVVAMVLEGKGVIAAVRAINGATNPVDAQPGTIRGDYAVHVGRNVVHASDSPESAEREIGLYFNENELLEYNITNNSWLYE